MPVDEIFLRFILNSDENANEQIEFIEVHRPWSIHVQHIEYFVDLVCVQVRSCLHERAELHIVESHFIMNINEAKQLQNDTNIPA